MSESDLEVLLLAGPFEVRGSCTYTLRLAAGLLERGVRLAIATPDARSVSPRERARLGIREFRRLDTPLWGHVVRRFLLADVRGEPPHIIHIQSRRALKAGNWLARALNRPYFLTVHERLEPGARLPIDSRHCRKIIALSDSVRDDLVSGMKLPADLVTVIPCGVETAPSADLTPPLDPGHVPVVATAGPLEAVKGFPYFLGAARRVLNVREEVEFLVAGAGPEEANLRRLARELGIAEKVTFVPYLMCFTESLAAADIFCLPSLQQGLGTIMLEAMALGRPVIAAGVGGVASVIRDGQTCLIVAPEQSADLARRIIELLDQPARARAIGAQARQLVVEEYGMDAMLQKTIQLYREVASIESASHALSAASGPG